MTSKDYDTVRERINQLQQAVDVLRVLSPSPDIEALEAKIAKEINDLLFGAPKKSYLEGVGDARSAAIKATLNDGKIMDALDALYDRAEQMYAEVLGLPKNGSGNEGKHIYSQTVEGWTPQVVDKGSVAWGGVFRFPPKNSLEALRGTRLTAEDIRFLREDIIAPAEQANKKWGDPE